MTVVKLFANGDEKQKALMPLVSRTLCKLATISQSYVPKREEDRPKEGEFWWVRIEQETFAKGRSGPSGMFVLEPIKKVAESQKILRLLPGLFHHSLEEEILIVRPIQNPELPWIFPLQIRKSFMEKYKARALIVDLTPPDYAKVLQPDK